MSLMALRATSSTSPGLTDLGAAGFARDHDAVGGAEGFAGGADVPGAHAFLGAFAEEQVHHFVGDAVADLVGMAFGNAFGGEQIVGTRHAGDP